MGFKVPKLVQSCPFWFQPREFAKIGEKDLEHNSQIFNMHPPPMNLIVLRQLLSEEVYFQNFSFLEFTSVCVIIYVVRVITHPRYVTIREEGFPAGCCLRPFVPRWECVGTRRPANGNAVAKSRSSTLGAISASRRIIATIYDLWKNRLMWQTYSCLWHISVSLFSCLWSKFPTLPGHGDTGAGVQCLRFNNYFRFRSYRYCQAALAFRQKQLKDAGQSKAVAKGWAGCGFACRIQHL